MFREDIPLSDFEWTLPLFDDPHLKEQGQNVLLIDVYLRFLERDLVKEYVEGVGHPVVAARVASALSHMWALAVYELLRTWRERVRKLKQDAQKPFSPIIKEANRWATFLLRIHLDKLREDSSFAKELDRAYTRVEPVFRKFEALRMNLAKHQVPKMKGVPAMEPGNTAIDKETGCVAWMIDLGNKKYELFYRQSLGNELQNLVLPDPDDKTNHASA